MPIGREARHDTSFILFGATGDLTGRFLFPAFAHLIHADTLPSVPTIVGVGREPWDRAITPCLFVTLKRRNPGALFIDLDAGQRDAKDLPELE